MTGTQNVFSFEYRLILLSNIINYFNRPVYSLESINAQKYRIENLCQFFVIKFDTGMKK